MKAAALCVVVAAVMTVALARPGRGRMAECRGKMQEAREAMKQLMANLTEQECQGEASECLALMKECRSLLRPDRPPRGPGMLEAITAKVEELKTNMAACVETLGYTNVNMDAFPAPPATMEELREQCGPDFSKLTEAVGLTQDQLVPMFGCVADMQGKLEPYVNCINGN